MTKRKPHPTSGGNTSGSAVSQSLLLSLVPGPAVVPSALIQTFSSSTQSAYSGDVKNNDLLHGADTVQTGIAWATDGNITSSTFNLGAGGGAGYDVCKITSIAAWSGAGFMNQKYKLSIRYSGASRFTPIPDCTVNFQPFSDSTTVPGSTKVVITRHTRVTVIRRLIWIPLPERIRCGISIGSA